MDKRIAISGLMPARPFRMADNVFRLTPSESAASVTVSCKGARQNSRPQTGESYVPGFPRHAQSAENQPEASRVFALNPGG